MSLEQTAANPNVDVVNNMPDYGKYGSLLAGLALEGIDTDTGNGQKTFSDNFGLTRETEMPAVYTDFVVDYNSVYNNEIMAYEAGSYTTKYVYGGSEKLWQTVTHETGVTDTDFGANANTDVAVDGIGTAFYHLDRLGSTAFVTTAAEVDDGNGGIAVVSSVLAYVQYDEWGNASNLMAVYGEAEIYAMNAAGVEGIHNFTGHGYDQVLELYFAKARFYSAEDKRFIAADPVESGMNLYIYCSNNPLFYFDPLGLYETPVRDFLEPWGVKVDWTGNTVKNGVTYATVNVSYNGNSRQTLTGILDPKTSKMMLDDSILLNYLSVSGAAKDAASKQALDYHPIRDSVVEGVMAGTAVYLAPAVTAGVGKVATALGTALAPVMDKIGNIINSGLNKVGNFIYDKVPRIVDINKIINNPADEFITIGPKAGQVTQYIQQISQTGDYGQIFVTELSNGMYQIADGHHRIEALRQLGYTTIRVFFTK